MTLTEPETFESEHGRVEYHVAPQELWITKVETNGGNAYDLVRLWKSAEKFFLAQWAGSHKINVYANEDLLAMLAKRPAEWEFDFASLTYKGGT